MSCVQSHSSSSSIPASVSNCTGFNPPAVMYSTCDVQHSLSARESDDTLGCATELDEVLSELFNCSSVLSGLTPLGLRTSCISPAHPARDRAIRVHRVPSGTWLAASCASSRASWALSWHFLLLSRRAGSRACPGQWLPKRPPAAPQHRKRLHQLPSVPRFVSSSQLECPYVQATPRVL